MDKIHSHMFSIFAEERQKIKLENTNRTQALILHAWNIVLRIVHFVKLTFVIFIYHTIKTLDHF